MYSQLLHGNYISAKHEKKLFQVKICSPTPFRKFKIWHPHIDSTPSLLMCWHQKWLAMSQMPPPWLTRSTFS